MDIFCYPSIGLSNLDFVVPSPPFGWFKFCLGVRASATDLDVFGGAAAFKRLPVFLYVEGANSFAVLELACKCLAGRWSVSPAASLSDWLESNAAIP
ncbi:hypothetical protein Nepgr_006550 [Nepenthes gracilis]|uniref:Uncharacterized protein n=1 Tax=Nepenthes gracilis TaxID=150966 RepID=A0AAD3XHJ4_NEPGR|nr:hypothetical protein Nepgr_006550 [Nepenthes gracilis]